MLADVLTQIQVIEDWHLATALAIFWVVSLPFIGRIRTDRNVSQRRRINAEG